MQDIGKLSTYFSNNIGIGTRESVAENARSYWRIISRNFNWAGTSGMDFVYAYDFTICRNRCIILTVLAGLESDLELLKKYFKPGMLVAVIGVIVPVVVVFGFAHLWGFNLHQQFFLGITFAATSVSISVEVLKELHALEGRNGATILGAAVVDDILTVLILSFTVAVLGEQKTTSVPFGCKLSSNCCTSLEFILWSDGQRRI